MKPFVQFITMKNTIMQPEIKPALICAGDNMFIDSVKSNQDNDFDDSCIIHVDLKKFSNRDPSGSN